MRTIYLYLSRCAAPRSLSSLFGDLHGYHGGVVISVSFTCPITLVNTCNKQHTVVDGHAHTSSVSWAIASDLASHHKGTRHLHRDVRRDSRLTQPRHPTLSCYNHHHTLSLLAPSQPRDGSTRCVQSRRKAPSSNLERPQPSRARHPVPSAGTLSRHPHQASSSGILSPRAKRALRIQRPRLGPVRARAAPSGRLAALRARRAAARQLGRRRAIGAIRSGG